MAPRVIRDNTTFFECYDDLSPGDIMFGRIRLYPGEEHLLLDIMTREILMIPSALSQLCSRSKVFQTRVLGRFMAPGTAAVYCMNDMIRIVSEYGRDKTGKVVCKLDRANGGLGILQFSSIEEVYSLAALGTLSFPFVVQPFQAESKDVRVVMLGDYKEAYLRHNPNNFRHNLHCGGMSASCDLTDDQIELSREIMNRARFPYAHIDLLITSSGSIWLNEINLRGGLRGAVISQQDYIRAVDKIHADLLGQYAG